MWAAACMSMCLLVACNNEKKQQPDDTQARAELNAATEQEAKPTEFNQAYTAEFNGRHYDIRMKRVSAVYQPKVVDEFGNEFYDNRVQVSVSCEGKALFDKDFTKATFAPYLRENEKKETILLGMAYDASHSNSKTLCLGAQVGLVGIEEGPAFRVSISLDGGSVVIERDAEQDTTGGAGMEE